MPQKLVNAIIFSADDVNYKPGDSIGIIPENDKGTVEKIIALTGF